MSIRTVLLFVICLLLSLLIWEIYEIEEKKRESRELEVDIERKLYERFVNEHLEKSFCGGPANGAPYR